MVVRQIYAKFTLKIKFQLAVNYLHWRKLYWQLFGKSTGKKGPPIELKLEEPAIHIRQKTSNAVVMPSDGPGKLKEKWMPELGAM